MRKCNEDSNSNFKDVCKLFNTLQKHAFCFGCIESWSKHENRCPLCKGRFSYIERLKDVNVLTAFKKSIFQVHFYQIF